MTRETAGEKHIKHSNSVWVNFHLTYVRCTCSPGRHTLSQRHTFRANYWPQSLHSDNVKRNVTTGCKDDLLKAFKAPMDASARRKHVACDRWVAPAGSPQSHVSLMAPTPAAWLPSRPGWRRRTRSSWWANRVWPRNTGSGWHRWLRPLWPWTWFCWETQTNIRSQSEPRLFQHRVFASYRRVKSRTLREEGDDGQKKWFCAGWRKNNVSTQVAA